MPRAFSLKARETLVQAYTRQGRAAGRRGRRLDGPAGFPPRRGLYVAHMLLSKNTFRGSQEGSPPRAGCHACPGGARAFLQFPGLFNRRPFSLLTGGLYLPRPRCTVCYAREVIPPGAFDTRERSKGRPGKPPACPLLFASTLARALHSTGGDTPQGASRRAGLFTRLRPVPIQFQRCMPASIARGTVIIQQGTLSCKTGHFFTVKIGYPMVFMGKNFTFWTQTQNVYNNTIA